MILGSSTQPFIECNRYVWALLQWEQMIEPHINDNEVSLIIYMKYFPAQVNHAVPVHEMLEKVALVNDAAVFVYAAVGWPRPQ